MIGLVVPVVNGAANSPVRTGGFMLGPPAGSLTFLLSILYRLAEKWERMVVATRPRARWVYWSQVIEIPRRRSMAADRSTGK